MNELQTHRYRSGYLPGKLEVVPVADFIRRHDRASSMTTPHLDQ